MTIDRELLGSVLPAYDIGDIVGRGGWGYVVSGQHRQLDRQVAIKQLPANPRDRDAPLPANTISSHNGTRDL